MLQLGDGVFEVKATSGNNHLGGDDFDNVIVQWMARTFHKNEGIDLSTDKMALQRLREAAEKAKIELSGTLTTSINLPFITADETGPKHLEVDLSRAQFEELAKNYIEGTLKPVQQALKDSELTADQIDRIILVGGSTRIPAVQQAIQNFFKGKQADRSINPDEAVALGAAIQAGVLGGEVEDVLLLDVTPISLGIETLGEVFTKVIDRNTTVPTSKSQTFSTATDGQTSVEIHVLQGERALAKDNKSLGKFLLTGIPPAPRGLPQIEVSFEIDVNGILQVSAQDKGTGKAQSIKITNTGGLSAAEVDKMRAEAAQFEEQDRRRLQIVELQNQADSLFYSFETTLRENSSLFTPEKEAELTKKRRALEKAFGDESLTTEAVQSLLDDFRDSLLAIGTQIYDGTGTDAPQSTSMPNEPDPSFDSEHETMVIASGVDGLVENGEGSITGDYEEID